MSSSAVMLEGSELDAELPSEQSLLAEVPLAEPAPVLSASVKQHWIEGTAALTAAVMVERGTGLLANVLAARLGGAAVFGSYSLAISTANNISTYAAGGIGATATRFSGKYPFGSRGYGSLARALAVVSLTSAVLAAGVLWAGATPLAHLLGKPSVAGLLRWASLSAAAMILLECARGFFVGQRRIAALLVLSLLVGGGLLIFLPIAAHGHNPSRMVVLQAAVCCGAVLACFGLSSRLALRGKVRENHIRIGPMLREVWGFGFVQLSGMVAANLAGWWLTTLIARSDTTLVEVGFFAIASQMRNLAGVIPGLLTEGSYAVMASPEEARADAREGAQHRVMALSSYGSTLAGVAIACVGIVAAPWALRLLYGQAYVPAQAALAVALALAVAHMSNATAAARLTIVSIRTAGVINTVWAAFVAAAATAFLLHHGGAWEGLAILLVAHLISGSLVLQVLRRRDAVPRGMRTVYYVGSLGAMLLAGMSLVRAYTHEHVGLLTALMCLVAAGQLCWLALLGKRHHWLPSAAAVIQLRERVFSRFAKKESAHV